jgi:hypothetical protein
MKNNGKIQFIQMQNQEKVEHKFSFNKKANNPDFQSQSVINQINDFVEEACSKYNNSKSGEGKILDLKI